jgi:hypothetical protein
MPSLRVLGFDGLQPRTSPTMLGDNMAQLADNVKLYSQELRAWRGPVLTVGSPTVPFPQTLYKLYNSGAPKYLTYSSIVDIVPGPIADVSDYRIYMTGRTVGKPEKTNNALLAGPTYYPMGIPTPAAKPTVALAGGSGTAENRVYVYTYVGTFGSITEEGAPSPPSDEIAALPGGIVTVAGFTAPPAGYNITHRRIYRSVAGETTDVYQFVAEIPLASTNYGDNLTSAQLGEALGTIGWAEPPATLQGLVAHPGGFLAGFVGNTVYFSHPFYPHAWPSAYGLSVAFPIIGLSVFGSSIAVMTEKNPYVITGSAPGALSAERLPMEEPCLSKLTIAGDQSGVVYASPNGMIGIGAGFVGNMTRDLFTRDEWKAISPSLMRGVVYGSQYFGIFPALANGKAIVLNRGDKPAYSRLDLNATAVHIDAREGNLYYGDAADGMIYQADADEVDRLNFVWRSKRVVFPKESSFSIVRVDADFSQLQDDDIYNVRVAAIAAANAIAWGQPLKGALNETVLNYFDINGSTLQNQPTTAAARSLQLLVYGDEVLQATLDISSLGPLRLPAFRSRSFEFELAGNIDVRSIQFATTVAELWQ